MATFTFSMWTFHHRHYLLLNLTSCFKLQLDKEIIFYLVLPSTIQPNFLLNKLFLRTSRSDSLKQLSAFCFLSRYALPSPFISCEAYRQTDRQSETVGDSFVAGDIGIFVLCGIARDQDESNCATRMFNWLLSTGYAVLVHARGHTPTSLVLVHFGIVVLFGQPHFTGDSSSKTEEARREILLLRKDQLSALRYVLLFNAGRPDVAAKCGENKIRSLFFFFGLFQRS